MKTRMKDLIVLLVIAISQTVVSGVFDHVFTMHVFDPNFQNIAPTKKQNPHNSVLKTSLVTVKTASTFALVAQETAEAETTKPIEQSTGGATEYSEDAVSR